MTNEYAWGFDYATRDIILSKDYTRVYAGMAYVKQKDSDLKPLIAFEQVAADGSNEQNKMTAFSPLKGKVVSNQ